MIFSDAVLSVATLVSGACAALYIIPQIVERTRILRKSTEKALADLLADFLDERNTAPGNDFGKLLSYGGLRTVKTGNHGADFPDGKMLESFQKYDAAVMGVTLDRIGQGL